VRFKLDENLPAAAVAVLTAAGHDVDTVVEEKLAGQPDPRILEACHREARTLITLDKGFANIRMHPPQGSAGIIVLRLVDQSIPALESSLRALASLLESEDPRDHLWIVGDGSIRMHPGNA
jgi:predicted nuclease of predicted toxin-antitoxin system